MQSVDLGGEEQTSCSFATSVPFSGGEQSIRYNNHHAPRTSRYAHLGRKARTCAETCCDKIRKVLLAIAG